MIQSLLDSLDLDPLLERVSTIGWVQELVLIGGFVVAAVVVDFVINRVVRLAVGRTRTDLDDRFISLLHRPVLSSVIGLGLWVAVLRAEPTEGVRLLVGRLLLTALLAIWAWFGVRASLLIIEAFGRIQERKQLVDNRMLLLMAMLTRALVIAASLYFLLSLWGISVGPLLGTAGVLGIVLGLAAKDTLSNFFAGISIMADAPYQLGDYVVLDSGERGEVTKVGLRSTRLRTRDDVEITIPNSVMANVKIVNQSGPSQPHRIRADIQVAYGTDLERAREILLEVANKVALIQEQPEPRLRLRGFGASGIDFQLMGWVEHPKLRGRALDSLYGAIYKRLDAEGIEIPFPTRTVLLPHPAGADTGR